MLSESFQKLFEILAFRRSLYIIDLLDLHKLRARIVADQKKKKKDSSGRNYNSENSKHHTIKSHSGREKFLDSVRVSLSERFYFYFYFFFFGVKHVFQKKNEEERFQRQWSSKWVEKKKKIEEEATPDRTAKNDLRWTECCCWRCYRTHGNRNRYFRCSQTNSLAPLRVNGHISRRWEILKLAGQRVLAGKRRRNSHVASEREKRWDHAVVVLIRFRFARRKKKFSRDANDNKNRFSVFILRTLLHLSHMVVKPARRHILWFRKSILQSD